MFGSSAVFPFDSAILSGTKVFLGPDVRWIVRLRWKYVVTWEGLEVNCVGFCEVAEVVSGWVAMVFDEESF